jgi:Tfp pilus assembly protein PilX
MSLVIVLALVALLQLLALAQLDVASIALRGATGLRDRVVAFYGADAALRLCANWLSAGRLPARVWREPVEPGYWRVGGAFEAAAVAVAPSWPGAAQVPRCLLEMTELDGAGPHYLLTAMGSGAVAGTASWLQAAAADRPAQRWYWRSVAAGAQ